MAFQNGPTIVTKGLVLSLDAGDRNSYPGTGTICRDLSGKNNNGTLTNGPTFSSLNGGSIVLDGTNDFIATDITTGYSTLSYTLSVFTYPEFNSSTFGRSIIAKSASCNPAEFAFEYGRTSNKFSFVTRNDVTLTSVQTYPAFQWYHAVIQRVNNGNNTYTSTLFVNGIVDTATTVNYTGPNQNIGIYIGRSPGCPGVGTFQGKIGPLQIYNRALSAAEILQNYNAQKSRFNL